MVIGPVLASMKKYTKGVALLFNCKLTVASLSNAAMMQIMYVMTPS
jgi:hypothetical protein